MSKLEELLRKYPGTEVVDVKHQLDKQDFTDQKTKQLANPIEGASIAVVWTSDTDIVLTSRTSPHKGWALPGGKVDSGEGFDEALLREIYEETGLQAVIIQLLLVERKVFVSPAGEELPITLAVFEAEAKGQDVLRTDDAAREGIVARTFAVNELPEEMILKDREKVTLVARQAMIL